MSEVSKDSVVYSWAKLKAKYLNQVYGNDPNGISEEGFDLLGDFMGQPIKKIYAEVARIVDETPYEQLIFKPIKDLQEFKNFFYSKIPQKAFFTFMNTWPSVMPSLVPTVEPMVRLLDKMTLSSALPEKFLGWIYSVLAQRHWSQEQTKPNLLAASLVKPKNECKLLWALLTDEKHIVLMEEDDAEKGGFKAILNEKADKLINDDGCIAVCGEGGQEIANLELLDKDTAQLWVNAFEKDEKQQPTLLQFLTRDCDKFPFDVLVAVSACFSQNNMDYVRAILIPNAISYSSPSQLVDTFSELYTVARYYQKVTLMNHSVLTAIFEQPSATVEYLTGKDSPLHALYDYYAQEYGKPYYENFVSKIVTYVNAKAGGAAIDSIPPEQIEQVLLTCIKYILASIQFFPPELQHLASMLQSYADIKFNCKVATFRILADFFVKHVLCSHLRYVGGNNSPLSGIADLLEIALCLQGTFKDTKLKLPTMDKRISKKYGKLIEEFIFETTVLFYVKDGKEIRSAPEYDAPSQMELIKKCGSLAKKLVSNSNKLVNIYLYLKDDQLFQTSSLGWALCDTILDYFKSEQEDERNTKEKEKKPVIKQAYLSSLTGRMCEGPDDTQIPRSLGLIPTKTYKRVKKTQKSIVSGQAVEEGMVVEEKIVSEILNEDGTKKTVIKKTVHRKK